MPFHLNLNDDTPEYDMVMIALHRVSTTEYVAIRYRLRDLPCAKELREDDPTV